MLFWPINAVLVALLVVVSVYDLYHFVIPDEFIYTLVVVALIISGLEYYQHPDAMVLAWNTLASLLGFSFFAGLWKYSEGRWIGFGDAKLAIPLGFMAGIEGIFSMLVLAFWVGTVISLGIIAWQKLVARGQLHLRFMSTTLTIKSEVPFAPFLIIGFLAAYLYSVDVLKLFEYVL
jgi:prepilin signal peptidase PulO-like enzyme (type II secretory pathway)